MLDAANPHSTALPPLPPTAPEPQPAAEQPASVDAEPADSTRDLPAPQDWVPGTQVWVPSGKHERAQANIAALEVLNELRDQERFATPAEQEIIAQWSGWGAVPEVFDPAKGDFADERARLEQLLDSQERAHAQGTVLNAHYTDPAIVAETWKLLGRAGFSGGYVLEPGSGSGTFIGHAPSDAQMIGVELDSTTSRVAAALYPSAQIRNESFADTALSDNVFTATVGNVPFGRYSELDRAHNKDRHSIHNHFIIKSLNLTAPGGYVALITSRYTADARDSRARQAMADRADLVAAARFPEQTFRRVAGTDVATDLLIFRVREQDASPSLETLEFVNTTDLHFYDTDPATGQRKEVALPVNSYFDNRPDHVLGSLGRGRNQFGNDELAVIADGDLADIPARMAVVLGRDIDAAVAQGRGLNVGKNLAYDAGVESAGLTRPLPLEAAETPGTLRYVAAANTFQSFYAGQWLDEKCPENRKPQWRAMLQLRDLTRALIDAQKDAEPVQVRNALRAELNDVYDAYVTKYGFINRYKWVAPVDPTHEQHAERLAKAKQAWVADYGDIEGVATVDDIPEDVVERLSADAWAPVRSGFKQQLHLQGAIRNDPHFATVLALENFDDSTQTASKAEMMTTDVLVAASPVTRVDTLEDALAVSLDEGASVNIDRIAELLGTDADSVQRDIETGALAFRSETDPTVWLPRTGYLSGNVRVKLDKAQQLAANDERYLPNVRALRDVQPTRIENGINAAPGVTWIGVDDYKQFLVDTFKLDPDDVVVTHNEAANKWTVQGPKGYRGYRQHSLDFGLVPQRRGQAHYNFVGTELEQTLDNQGVSLGGDRSGTISHFALFEMMLNADQIVVNKSKGYQEKTPAGGTTHPTATRALQEKVKLFEAEFASWALDGDPERRERLITEYNYRFNAYVAPRYDGSKRTFPGLGPGFEPYTYQRNAVERIVNEPTVLLNHVVGAGKTGTMILGAMELKRLGLVRQPWLVVPNHLVDQITVEAKHWAPGANILSGSGRTTKESRQLFVAQSAARDWDLVVVPQSTFTRINVSPATRANALQRQLDELRESLEEAKASGTTKLTIKIIETTIKQTESKLREAIENIGRDDGLLFEQTGCDYLFLDEAHHAKNLARQSPKRELSHSGSEFALDIRLKLDNLRERRRQEAHAAGVPADAYVERVATFATGTPVSNSISEWWVMQTYLAPDMLKHAGVSHINQWGSTFTKSGFAVELDASGTKFRAVERVRSFTNVPELAAMNASFTDRVSRDDVEAELATQGKASALPTKVGGSARAAGNVIVEFEPDIELRDFIYDLGYRADNLDARRPDIDNLLKIASDGRNATLDPRVAHLPAPKDGGRARKVATNVLDRWHATRDTIYTDRVTGQQHPRPGGLQIVFCDRSTPKKDGRWNMYEGIKDELVAGGMPAEQIAFIHNYPKDSDKNALFAKCRDGRISVLIGSTEKMGTGMNVQDRAVALHHVDVPWRPADLEQREGRIIRQGNQNTEVSLYNYIATGTYDTAMWQVLQRKAEFIAQIDSADAAIREMEDISSDEFAQSAAFTKALATGDNRYLREIELGQELDEMRAELSSHNSAVRSRHTEIAELQKSLPRLQTKAEAITTALPAIAQWEEAESKTWTVAGQDFTVRKEASPALLEKVRNLFSELQGKGFRHAVPIGSIAGQDIHARLGMETGALSLSFDNMPYLHTVMIEPSDVGITNHGQGHQPDTKQSEAALAGGIMTRLENTLKSARNHLAVTQQTAADNQARLDQLNSITDTPYPRLAELRHTEKELEQIQAELKQAETSDAAHQAELDRAQRMLDKGRDPGYSLILNPTPAWLEVNGFDTAADARAELARREREAQAFGTNTAANLVSMSYVHDTSTQLGCAEQSHSSDPYPTGEAPGAEPDLDGGYEA